MLRTKVYIIFWKKLTSIICWLLISKCCCNFYGINGGVFKIFFSLSPAKDTDFAKSP